MLIPVLATLGGGVLPEYVYGPDYVDEFVAQMACDDGDAVYYVLQDANYNVVGLVDDAGSQAPLLEVST